MSTTDEIKKDLRPQHKRFAQEYVANGFNGTQAYKTVYKRVKNDNTASSSSYDLLRKPEIRDYIDYLKEENDKKALELAGVTMQRIAAERAAIAFTNIGDIQKDWGENKSFSLVSDKAKKAIQEVKVYKNERFDAEGNKIGEKTTIVTKLHDKMKALDKLEEMLHLKKEDEATPAASGTQPVFNINVSNMSGEAQD